MFRNTHSLKSLNTFGIDVSAHQIITAEKTADLLRAWDASQKENRPFMILGEGSNVLFLEDYTGTIVVNKLNGINVTEDNNAWYLHVGAGENWHKLVEYSLQKELRGLENLAMIPGTVGSAPIQNIGAYGVELKQICDYVEVLNLKNGTIERIDAVKCQFGYRDSIFKHRYREGYAVIAVGLCLKKNWQPVTTYGELAKLNFTSVTAIEIFSKVCQMRCYKLPNPQINGNAGSFFKNPIVKTNHAAAIIRQYSKMPQYPQNSGEVKLAAGWLIEQCGLKGYCKGKAATHDKQALVIINQGNATGQDIVALAHDIRQRVGEKFNVWLEPEVRFIGANGEKDAVEVIT